MTATLEALCRPGHARRGITFVDRSAARLVTYDELNGRAAGVASRLTDLGIRPGGAVAVCLDNSADSVAVLLGIWQAGLTVVSIPPNPRGAAAAGYGPALTPVLERIQVAAVVGPPRVTEAVGSVVGADERRCRASDLVHEPVTTFSPGAPIPDIGLIQFTSGSTGAPRGVALRKETVAGHVRTIVAALDADGNDVATSWLPLHHDMGLIGMLLGPLTISASLTLMTPATFVRDPSRWLTHCATTGTSITAAPNFAYRLTTLALRAGADPGDLSHLRACLAGAERVSQTVMEEFVAAAAPFGLPRHAPLPVYGLAEATLAVTFPAVDSAMVGQEGDTVSCGRPLDGVELRITDVDEGGRGRLAIRGRWMLDHYVTADGPQDPFTPDGWFPTSDVASLVAGDLYVYGRDDEVAIVHGRNIYAEDIESIVDSIAGGALGLHAAFRFGADRFVVAAEWLGLSDEPPESLAQQIRIAITNSLGVPLHSVRVCAPRTLPVTTSGKVKRATCRAMFEAGWPPDADLAVA